MYILELDQAGVSTQIGAFNTIEEGRVFVSQIPSYEIEDIDGIIYEFIMATALPDYMEVTVKDHKVPLTRFMFPDEERVEIFWKELPDLSTQGQGMVSGSTRVDAYRIANEDVKAYITRREHQYHLVKAYLEEKGFKVDRSFHGSQDGEAIVYKKPDAVGWHFLTHLDPCFCNQEDIRKEVEEILIGSSQSR